MRHFSISKLSHVAGLLIATCWVTGLSSCGGSTNDVASDGVLRRGLAGEPSSLDPATAADNFSFQLLQDLYEGLTIASADGQVLPGVASSWNVDPTGTEY